MAFNAHSSINSDRLRDSFLRYVKIDTGSDEILAETQTPSTKKQFDLANLLFKELKEDLKLEEVEMDSHAIVTATLPSNMGNDESLPVLGLLAHMDTSPSVPTGPVNPIIHKNYQGGNILLDDGKVQINASDLEAHIGKDIITSDGKTLLGSDDKAGIAEILEAVRVFQENPEILHPKIRIAFTVDEETGCGIDVFDIKKFGVDVAYTVDGDLPQILEEESFNAFNPEIIFQGVNVHPGYAYKKMINSLIVANDFIANLPRNEFPDTTKDYEGYFHVMKVQGDETETKMSMLVRDFNYDKAVERIQFLKDLAEKLEKKHNCKISVDPREKYRNMKFKIMELPEVSQFAMEGIKRSGLSPKTKAVRGGTDGSILTMRGLLTPNLGAGGNNFHGKNEYVPIQDMVKCCENVINVIRVWAEKAKEVAPKIAERRKKM